MARYRFTGEGPVSVPDLKRFEDDPVMPGEVIETDTVINNACFVLLVEDQQTLAVPAVAEMAPAETPDAAPEES